MRKGFMNIPAETDALGGNHDMEVRTVTNSVSPATIRDVAARAGVALSSVSRVVSGHPDVSVSMREKVEAAAKALGYEPDILAQSLRRGSTLTIGFALRDISNPLFANIARRCEQELRQAGYSMIIVSSDGDIAVEERNLALLRRRRVDGIIASLVDETSSETRKSLSALPCPVVLLDREIAGFSGSSVLCDHFTGVRLAVEELISRGHSEILLITGSLSVRSSRERKRGYDAAFHAAGLTVDPRLLAFGGFDVAFAQAETVRLLSGVPAPTALLTGGVATTAGALQGLRELRLRPGDDVALVALDEWPMFEAFTPGLSSVARDSDEMGTSSARLMLDMLQGSLPRTTIIGTSFFPRESLGPASMAAKQAPR
jgi:LacI family transcriptional regulator